jgi:hypothetical protein
VAGSRVGLRLVDDAIILCSLMQSVLRGLGRGGPIWNETNLGVVRLESIFCFQLNIKSDFVLLFSMWCEK